MCCDMHLHLLQETPVQMYFFLLNVGKSVVQHLKDLLSLLLRPCGLQGCFLHFFSQSSSWCVPFLLHVFHSCYWLYSQAYICPVVGLCWRCLEPAVSSMQQPHVSSQRSFHFQHLNTISHGKVYTGSFVRRKAVLCFWWHWKEFIKSSSIRADNWSNKVIAISSVKKHQLWCSLLCVCVMSKDRSNYFWKNKKKKRKEIKG